jgi:hypothetical protein
MATRAAQLQEVAYTFAWLISTVGWALIYSRPGLGEGHLRGHTIHVNQNATTRTQLMGWQSARTMATTTRGPQSPQHVS